ncbi:HNH endonuclease [Pseudomonas sp. RC4D1]|uniref:NUMOD4 motif-containing HNH endonuclease n=1 Tax=Pseudomonas sp. RC4D1 TaxID=2834407 RepID=UPI001BD144CC|nr:NUMOD4 motif-containing HNH endonuclease [Pseudomonas sp. RC4D1]MBS7559949.1 HNH endonuclease [Pseudomonas sp. RC4D1]
MADTWKEISFCPGYEVCSSGLVRSKDRTVFQAASRRSSAYERFLPGKVLKPFPAKKTGYLQVSLSKKERRSVHQLVALAFCSGFKEGLIINHKNGIRTDNRAENLEWVTHSENVAHGFSHNGRKANGLGKFGSANKASKAVVATEIATGIEKLFPSGMDAVRAGFSSCSISRCCAGKIKSHKGHTWRFSEPKGQMPEQWEQAA